MATTRILEIHKGRRHETARSARQGEASEGAGEGSRRHHHGQQSPGAGGLSAASRRRGRGEPRQGASKGRRIRRRACQGDQEVGARRAKGVVSSYVAALRPGSKCSYSSEIEGLR